MMECQTLRQSKGQTVQSFTEEFRKKALALNIPLDSYENLMKYIGALHSYIHHTLLLFNPLVLTKFVCKPLNLRTGGDIFKKIPRRNLPISHKILSRSSKGQEDHYSNERRRKTILHSLQEGRSR
jgi:hypothetical protein